MSRCPGFVLDLRSSDPSLENVYLSQYYYVLNVRCRLLLVVELDAGPVARTTSAVG